MMFGKNISAILAERKPIILGLATFMLMAIVSPGLGVELEFPDTTMTRGETIDIPLYTEDVTDSGVVAYEVHFDFNTSALTPVDVIEAGTLTSSWGDAVWAVIGNEVRIVAAGITPLTGSGVLCYVRMIAPLTGSSNSTLNLTYGMFNEGTPTVTLNDGYVTIYTPPYITVSPNTATLTRGDALQFTVSGGTPPYTFDVTDPSVLYIDPSTGWSYALSRGVSRVIGEDNGGLRDTTGNIVVRDLKLTIRDTTYLSGQIVELPVYVTDVTGLGILGGEFSLTWTYYQLELLDVLETGTMLASWGDVTQHINPGELSVSFAGTTPLTGAGILMILQVRVTGVSSATYVEFHDPLFNEVIEANTQRGYVSITPPPSLSISPNTATLVIGDSLQFSVGGGATPPLTWGTTDPLVADISTTGMLHALSIGDVLVTVEDFYGFTDSSGTISVCGFRIQVPWVQSSSGRAVEMPIELVGDATGLGVMSFEITLGYNDNIAYAQSVIQTGTMTSSWWPAVLNVEPNAAHIAAAGTTPLTGGDDDIIIVEFYVDPGATVGQYTNVNITYLLFNEGDVCAVTSNGGITVVVGQPDPVTDLVIVRSGTSVTLHWSDVTLRDGYNVYRYDDAGLITLDSQWMDVSDEDPVTPGYQWTDPTVNLGVDEMYFYIVRSFLN